MSANPFRKGSGCLLVVIAVCAVGPFLWRQYDKRVEQRRWNLLNSVPIGAKVRDLQPLSNDPAILFSSVNAKELQDGKQKTRELGNVTESKIFALDNLNFNGKIEFTIEEPIGQWVALIFHFNNGKLTKRTWGFYPG